jgi:coenzyme Q-binding protein COQ10
LQYELASRTLALLMGPVFDIAFGRFVQAFERRADIVYARQHVHLSPHAIPSRS